MVDVIISGCGPAGVIAANLLGMQGISTVVFDREKDIFPLPRAVVIDDDIARIIQSAGLIDKVLAVSPSSKGYKFLDQSGNPMFGFKRSGGYTKNGYTATLSIRQPEIEASLRQGLDRFPHVNLHTEHQVEGVVQDEKGVTVTVRDLQRNTLKEVEGKYLLAAEGARSIVRKQLGIELHDYQYDHLWLIVDVLAKEELDLPEMNLQYCNPDRPTTYIYHGKGQYRWEIMLKPGESAETVNREEVIKQLISPWVDPAKVEIERTAVYKFHALLAKEWRKGRVFLLGDTAHQMPPFLGQGLSSGMRDAHNLVWKLSMVLKGQADEKILDTYQTERYPHVAGIIEKAVKLGKIIQISDQKLADLRDELFRNLHDFPNVSEALHGLERSSFPIGKGVHDAKASVSTGMLFIQPQVEKKDGEMVLFDEVACSRFILLGIKRDPLAAAESVDCTELARLSVKSIMVVESDEAASGEVKAHPETGVIVDREGKIAAWCHEHEVDYVLLRPDRYVFGACRAGELNALMISLVGALREPQRV
ncbi:bifunctional 3-(3-hydroxy-phenyl)propionate/3-hydroxycinnamic acid hydroxylase [Brevibacillus nitrificans]|uniref:bifunctional 3-(3-hydroxy-phenyl)propionate/3-hydroxycinnamic acid hydroxylase MhpA n=1 Tax=Brevibacillus nitrificans TaxID=651560 RepID=UPI002E24587A|nr:bifunctional 3-(3-hydroxy-phenyl)propionate/3-hydroxycinnamic acid hydroxylase [Brevibacillus nitrificans]